MNFNLNDTRMVVYNSYKWKEYEVEPFSTFIPCPATVFESVYQFPVERPNTLNISSGSTSLIGLERFDLEFVAQVLLVLSLLVVSGKLIRQHVRDVKELVTYLLQLIPEANEEECEVVYLDECMRLFERTCLNFGHVDESNIDILKAKRIVSQYIMERASKKKKLQKDRARERRRSFQKSRNALRTLIPSLIAARAITGLQRMLLTKDEVIKRIDQSNKQKRKTVNPTRPVKSFRMKTRPAHRVYNRLC